MQSSFLVFTDAVGIVAFALAGILAAKGRDVDPVGIFVVSFVTAFGGGIVRDVVIDNRPMYWIAHQEYVWLTMALAAVAPILIRRFEDKVLHTLLCGPTPSAWAFRRRRHVVVRERRAAVSARRLMGVCTGVFGGLLRDVFLNRLPMVMSDRLPYASAAFLGSWIYIALHEGAVASEFASLLLSSFSSWAFA